MNWFAFALLAAFFAALVAIFGKIGVKEIDSTVATAVRSVVMAAIVVATVAVQGALGKLSSIPRIPLFFILLSGIAGALSWLFYFRALQLGPASQVAPIDRLSAGFAVLLAVFFLGERLSALQVVGIVLLLSGTILIAVG